ncbi:hypothetical protein G9A89_013098 [Geosiphon pyriformis]|nr:hypothetical protein G9A89_013098 [Geosiphon pyriformis]
MDLKTASNSDMSKKKAPKGAFHGLKKRVVLGNVKHSGDEKNISLSKSGPSDSVYSNVDSVSGNDKNVGMTGVHGGSLLGSAATTSKAKRIDTSTGFGSLLGSPDFTMDDDEIELPPCMFIPLDKKWIDPKIVKTQIKVSVKKFFALDINLLAVEGKSATAKSQSMEKAALLARENGIIVNTDLKRQGVHSDQAVVIKKISIDMPKEMIVVTVFEYGQIVFIKVQLIGLWQKAVVEFAESSQADLLASKWSFLIEKDSVRVAKAVENHETWAFRDQFRALLFILLVGMTAYDLETLLEGTGRKTCVINHSLETGNRTCCVVVCFESDEAMESAFRIEPIFGGVKLSWARLDLVRCKQYGKFGHSALECNAEVALASQSPKSFKKPANLDTHLQLAKLYAKKKVLISRPVAFGGKSWAQVVSVASASHGSHNGSGSGSLPFDASSSGGTFFPLSMVDSPLGTRLARLEHSVELLSDQISNILLHLNNFSLVPLALSSSVIPSVSTFLPSISDSLMVADSDLGSNMVLDVLTSKVGILESKLVALDASIGSILVKLKQMCADSGPLNDIVCWHKDMGNLVSIFTEIKLKDKICSWIINKFDGVWVFTSGLDSGYLSAGVVVVMDSSLTRHVCKVSEVPGWLLSVKLLFKNKLSVSILGLYAGASLVIQFSQTDEINSLIAKAVNESSFVILGGDFNEDGSHKSASFKKCFDLGLVNSLVSSLAVKMPTWENSRSVKKTIDYVFVFPNLVNVIANCRVLNVSEHFDTDHQVVSVSLGLGGLLDMHLNSLCTQANRDCWKFDIKSANEARWLEFKDASAANASMFSDAFGVAVRFSDMDAIWDIVHKVMVFSAGGTFKKKWFKDFDGVFTKTSSKFHKLELLVSKLVKALRLDSSNGFASLLEVWHRLDSPGASVVKSLFLSGSNFDLIHTVLAKARKSYRSSKLLESKRTEESSIKQAIDKRMESFELNKGHTIRSVLEHPFHKVVLDHLVVKDELVLEPDLVKSKVDKIMEGWTRKRKVPLDYVFDSAFSDVMCLISLDELLTVVKNLPDEKAVGLSGISNKLWRHCDKSVLDMFLVLLNSCLVDRISLACSTFEVLCGDNFSVLKGMTMQSPIFAIGSVVEDALEKNHELWLVLQDMRKAYDSVGWEHLRRSLVRIKMCDRFIRFFGSIHNSHVNRVITDFGLTNGYCVHDGLDQGEVFSSLLWHIFYDSLLCEVKRQESVCGYRLNSHFISKTGQVDPQAGLTSFLAAGAFVDDTIWVGSSQAATQHILNVASEFFRFNDISINNDKTVAIPINCQVMDPCLTISGLPISIAKKRESHRYLDIFLFSKSLSKPSLAKAQTDMRFFVNLVLRKAVLDKQCAYLLSAVLFPIISYRTQFSFVFVGVCNKWDALVCKILKSKSGLPCDFLSDALHYPSLYNLKTFEQIQAESKLASVVAFANSTGVLGRLFSHRSYDLQVFSWCFRHPLLFPARVGVSPSNNFLAGVVCIFSGYDLSLGGSLTCVFRCRNGTLMFLVLGKHYFFKCVFSLRHYGIAFVEQLHDHSGNVFSWGTFKHWKRLDLRGPVPLWFDLSVQFLGSVVPPSICPSFVEDCAGSDVCLSHGFGVVCDTLLTINTTCLSVYTDGSLSGLGTVDMKAGVAIFFEDINSGLGVGVSGLVSSTLMELQAIALALECVLSFWSIDVFSDSQAAVDVYKSEFLLVYPDFRNRCWIERHHIANVICCKNLDVNWIKIKNHSGIPGNERADVLVKKAVSSACHLPYLVGKRFLKTGGTAVSGNSRHFVRDVFCLVHRTHWEVGSGSWVVADDLRTNINWSKSSLVWHPDSHLAAGFTSACMAGFWTYFMKALHCQLPIAVHKHLYDRGYPTWAALSGLSWSSLCVLQLLDSCVFKVGVGAALYKGLVFNDWYHESVSVFKDSEVGASKIVDFVRGFCLAFRDDIWLVRTRHRMFMEKHGLIPCDGSTPTLVSGLSMVFLAGVIRLLGVAEAFGVGFRYIV